LGLGAGAGYIHGYPNVKELGWRGLFEPSRFQGRQGGADTIHNLELPGQPLSAEENAEEQRAGDPTKQSSDVIGYALKLACAEYELVPSEDLFVEKAANIAGAGLGPIPTDRWGRVIMDDPFLDDQSKAVAAGLPFAATASTGSRWVSPMDVARVAANSALGRATGWGIGQLARTFLGCTPQLQEGLQQAGTLAGAVRGVLSML